MLLRKFSHACFSLTHSGQSLVVDPGGFTDDFVLPPNVVGIVITHQHGDHQQTELLRSIVGNTDVPIFTTDDTQPILKEFSNVRVVQPGEKLSVGAFSLEFFGGNHAIIDRQIVPIHNVGVMINQKVYYPGDSFTLPEKPVEVLALPVAAPWMKISEALEFLRLIKPKIAFPTHDAILSSQGKAIVDRLCTSAAAEIDTNYQRIDTLDIV